MLIALFQPRVCLFPFGTPWSMGREPPPVKRLAQLESDYELRQNFCYPGGGLKWAKTIRCARSDCYRGRNGSNYESEDTDRTFKQNAAALSKRWGEVQRQVAGPSPGDVGLSSQGGDPSLVSTGVSPRAADYYRATDPLRAEETSALVATDLASNRLCLRATTGGDVAGVDSGL